MKKHSWKFVENSAPKMTREHRRKCHIRIAQARKIISTPIPYFSVMFFQLNDTTTSHSWMLTFFIADVVSSQRFLREDFATGGVATEISDPELAEPAPADTAVSTLFVRDSDAPTDAVLFVRE